MLWNSGLADTRNIWGDRLESLVVGAIADDGGNWTDDSKTLVKIDVLKGQLQTVFEAAEVAEGVKCDHDERPHPISHLNWLLDVRRGETEG